MLMIPQFEGLADSDPALYTGLQQLIHGINNGFSKLAIDPAPATDTTDSAGTTQNFLSPLPPGSIKVITSAKGIFTITLTPNAANGANVQYTIETSPTPDFAAPTAYPFGNCLAGSLNLGSVTLYFRARSKYPESDFSAPLVLGAPTAINGALVGSSELSLNVPSNSTNDATVTSIDNGTNATIQVFNGAPGSAWHSWVGGVQTTRPALSITGNYSTAYWIYYDPVANVVSKATAVFPTLPDGLIYCGKVTTVAAGGGGGTSGGGSGDGAGFTRGH